MLPHYFILNVRTTSWDYDGSRVGLTNLDVSYGTFDPVYLYWGVVVGDLEI